MLISMCFTLSARFDTLSHLTCAYVLQRFGKIGHFIYFVKFIHIFYFKNSELKALLGMYIVDFKFEAFW